MAHHHNAKIGDHRHCGSSDIIILVFEEQGPTYSTLNLSLLFICKTHGMLSSNIRNFTILRIPAKVFYSVSNEANLILVARFLCKE